MYIYILSYVLFFTKIKHFFIQEINCKSFKIIMLHNSLFNDLIHLYFSY